MARQRSSKPTTTSQNLQADTDIPLSHPDRTPDPSRETLIKWATSRDLFEKDNAKPNNMSTDNDEENSEYQVGRLPESILWSLSLTIFHFTLDYLIQHQYAQEIVVKQLAGRALQAFPVILFLFYTLHPHPQPSIFSDLFPWTLREGYDELLRITLFFIAAVGAGCRLIHITNTQPFYAVMKDSAPIGVLWIWAEVELTLAPSVASLFCCLLYLLLGGYSFL